MEYPKIHSLFKRREFQKGLPKGRHGDLIPGDYACEEFGNIKLWDVEEKIDGTNIRVMMHRSQLLGSPLLGPEQCTVEFGGRTKDAQIPCQLLSELQKIFTPVSMDAAFPTAFNVTLFGEGYGPKINSGGLYSSQPGFCLFDVKIGSWWLERASVREVAEKLGVSTPPHFGFMEEEEIICFVMNKIPSAFAKNDPKSDLVMEGVMCRPKKLMLFRNGDPIQFKLKCKEFNVS